MALVGERRVERSTRRAPWVPTHFVTPFLALVVGATVAGKLPLVVLAVHLGASVVAFFAYGIDKSAAQKQEFQTTFCATVALNCIALAVYSASARGLL